MYIQSSCHPILLSAPLPFLRTIFRIFPKIYYVLILHLNTKRTILFPFFQVPRAHYNHFQILVTRATRVLFLLGTLKVRFAFASLMLIVEVNEIIFEIGLAPCHFAPIKSFISVRYYFSSSYYCLALFSDPFTTISCFTVSKNRHSG